MKRGALSETAPKGSPGQFFSDKHPVTGEVLPEGEFACILEHVKPYPERLRNSEYPWKVVAHSTSARSTALKSHLATWHGVSLVRELHFFPLHL